MQSHLLVLGVVAFLAACASEPAQQVAQTDPVCARETPTGSNISILRCRTKQEAEQEKAAAEQVKGSLRTQSSGDPAGRDR